MFNYYERLNPRMQAIYRASDRVQAIPLREPERMHNTLGVLREALAHGQRAAVADACQRLINDMACDLSVPAPEVHVLSCRPAQQHSELQGLYEQTEDAEATIRVWMRTSQRKQVVAFRTFLRTLLHELCHHLDYEMLRLPDSLHTEGFFKRESSLYKQLVGTLPAAPAAAGETADRSTAQP